MRNKITVLVLTISAAIILSSCGSSSSAVDSSAVSSEVPASSIVVESQSASEEEKAAEKEAEPRDGNFRIGVWGDTKETILEYETAELYEEADSVLYYLTRVGGYSACAMYIFDDEGKLYQGGYLITDTFPSGMRYINVYDDLKEKLSSVYGTPTDDEVVKLSDFADLTDEGDAIESGFTMYTASWETEDTEIEIELTSDYNMIIVIGYENINKDEINITEGL